VLRHFDDGGGGVDVDHVDVGRVGAGHGVGGDDVGGDDFVVRTNDSLHWLEVSRGLLENYLLKAPKHEVTHQLWPKNSLQPL
jgi:hypothetical protein